MWTSVFGLLCLLALRASAIYIDVTVDARRCVGQELDQEDVATLRLSATPLVDNDKETMRLIYVSLTDPDGSPILAETLTLQGDVREYARTIVSRGVYELCLELKKGEGPLLKGKNPARVSVDIDFKSRGIGWKSGGDVAAGKHVSVDYIPTLEDQLKAAEDILTDIGREIDFARRQEVLLRQAGESTQSRIQWFSAFSILVLVLTSLWQLIYLRKYFTDKKIL